MSKGTCTTIQLLATGVIAFLSEKFGNHILFAGAACLFNGH